mmetsp:Transcript_18285/g.56721  ORF Transcript_18285/g.56721 Transcript_18285/m.56721 type:complete len:210 (-) Transcript_18285:534-1163(-)
MGTMSVASRTRHTCHQHRPSRPPQPACGWASAAVSPRRRDNPFVVWQRMRGGGASPWPGQPWAAFLAAGSVKWNFEAPVAAMTTSKMANWPAVREPIMTQRAPRPERQSFLKPDSLARLTRREAMEPVPPAVGDLLIIDSRVSAGCEMMAAATPAMVPDDSAMAILVDSEAVFMSVRVAAAMASAALPWTANLAMVYGICLNRIGPKPE